jgi:hypothetical protein
LGVLKAAFSVLVKGSGSDVEQEETTTLIDIINNDFFRSDNMAISTYKGE